jgi:hypothetical protein
LSFAKYGYLFIFSFGFTYSETHFIDMYLFKILNFFTINNKFFEKKNLMKFFAFGSKFIKFFSISLDLIEYSVKLTALWIHSIDKLWIFLESKMRINGLEKYWINPLIKIQSFYIKFKIYFPNNWVEIFLKFKHELK